jgi:hypothetical protein
MTLRKFAAALILMTAYALCASAEETTPQWLDSYGAGMTSAKQSRRLMLVYFHQDKLALKQDQLLRKLTEDTDLRPLVEQHVLVRVPLSAQARVGGQEIRLIEHSAFAELQRRPGIAIIDFTNPKSEYYGHVTSIYPLSLPGGLTTSSAVVADITARVVDTAYADPGCADSSGRTGQFRRGVLSHAG